MRNAVIVEAVRTPVARAHPEKGWFRNVRSDELGVLVVRELIRRVGIDPREIEDIIMGCATQTGEQAMNVARYIAIMAGLTVADIDIAEINEAFAVVALVCMRELGVAEEKVNPNGGAVALGHPMGCTGAKLVTTLFHRMQRQKAKFGLVTVEVGMGQGEATVLERIDFS